MIADPPPLDPAVLAAAARPPLRAPVLVQSVGSTNDLAVRAARAGEPEGFVVVAEEQTAGRGRLSRGWVAPARHGLTLSALLRPPREGDQLAALPLVAGLAVAEAVVPFARLPVGLKWPNDILCGPSSRPAKLAGLLAELVAGAVVLGVGVNVAHHRLLPAGSTSLEQAAGSRPDRGEVLTALLGRLAGRYVDWLAEPGAALADYRARCRTIGRAVELALPGGERVRGVAVDVDATGRLVVDTTTGRRTFASGDVVHLRAGDG